MWVPNLNDYITVTTKRYIEEGCKLDILSPSEVYIKEKNDEYIILTCCVGIADINEIGAISLKNTPKETMIKKGETKKLTLPVTDYFSSVIIGY